MRHIPYYPHVNASLHVLQPAHPSTSCITPCSAPSPKLTVLLLAVNSHSIEQDIRPGAPLLAASADSAHILHLIRKEAESSAPQVSLNVLQENKARTQPAGDRKPSPEAAAQQPSASLERGQQIVSSSSHALPSEPDYATAASMAVMKQVQDRSRDSRHEPTGPDSETAVLVPLSHMGPGPGSSMQASELQVDSDSERPRTSRAQQRLQAMAASLLAVHWPHRPGLGPRAALSVSEPSANLKLVPALAQPEKPGPGQPPSLPVLSHWPQRIKIAPARDSDSGSRLQVRVEVPKSADLRDRALRDHGQVQELLATRPRSFSLADSYSGSGWQSQGPGLSFQVAAEVCGRLSSPGRGCESEC
eukprot:3240954-Rhodomonas_salina.4